MQKIAEGEASYEFSRNVKVTILLVELGVALLCTTLLVADDELVSGGLVSFFAVLSVLIDGGVGRGLPPQYHQ